MSTSLIILLVLAGVVMVALAIAMSLILGWANSAFHVEVDPKVDAINEALPGANCGGCGFVGCGDYAEAVVADNADVTLCAPGGGACAEAIAGIMGVEVDQTWPYKAVIHCVATTNDKHQRHEYRGEQTCTAANLVAGVQGCTYGCLGLGDCSVSCNYDAIEIVDGLAQINYEKCVGCKACAKACPRNIISMVPFKASEMMVVACANNDAGKVVKEVCDVGCIGCKACTKINKDLFDMNGNKPVFNYETYDPQCSLEDLAGILGKCRRSSLIYVGIPSEEDKEAVKDEELPDEIKADFKTTVDKTEWQG